MSTGTLYVVATPIGNLEDLSARAVRILGEVDLIAAEDTRHTGRLLTHFGIATRMQSYHEHNEAAKADALVHDLESGRSVALITDAGTPCVSDPGYRVVRAAHQRGIPVVPVPGASAPLAALSASGLPTDRFTFHGFFPRKQGAAQALLDQIAALGGTHLFFESPHRLVRLLGRAAEALPEAEVCVARELTKLHEEIVLGLPAEVADHFDRDSVKGECVVIVHVSSAAQPQYTPEDLRARVDECMGNEGLSRRDAVRRVASDLGLPRNAVYRAATESDSDTS